MTELSIIEKQLEELKKKLFYNNGNPRKNADSQLMGQYESLVQQYEAISKNTENEDIPLDTEQGEILEETELEEIVDNNVLVDPIVQQVPEVVQVDPVENTGPIPEDNCPEIYKKVDPTAPRDPERVDIRHVPKITTLQVGGDAVNVQY